MSYAAPKMNERRLSCCFFLGGGFCRIQVLLHPSTPQHMPELESLNASKRTDRVTWLNGWVAVLPFPEWKSVIHINFFSSLLQSLDFLLWADIVFKKQTMLWLKYRLAAPFIWSLWPVLAAPGTIRWGVYATQLKSHNTNVQVRVEQHRCGSLRGWNSWNVVIW